MRVVLASERIQAQNLLMDIVEEETGAVVVGQAENATKTLALVRNLRPDVAVIDCNLPYLLGMDTLALSRMSGLDTALIICQTLPGILVVIINNLDTLDTQVLPKPGLNEDSQAFFSRERIAGNTPFKLQELCREATLSEAPVFANIEVKAWPERTQNNDQVTEGAIFLGTAGLLGGGYLIGTLILAPVGALLALGGAVTLGFGLLKKTAARLWRK